MGFRLGPVDFGWAGSIQREIAPSYRKARGNSDQTQLIRGLVVRCQGGGGGGPVLGKRQICSDGELLIWHRRRNFFGGEMEAACRAVLLPLFPSASFRAYDCSLASSWRFLSCP